MKGKGNNKGYISNFIIFIVFIFLTIGGIFFPDWPLKTEEAQAATRFYLQNAAADYDPPTERGDWNITSSYTARKLSRTKSGTIIAKAVSESNGTDDYDVLLLKLISEPIPNAQTVSGTLNWVVGSQEESLSMNAHWHVHVFVTAGDTDTVRGTLYTNYTEPAGTNEWPTSAAGDGPTGAITLTSVAIQANDRIVIEAGYVARNSSSSSYTGTLWYGGTNSTDLTIGGDESTYPGWWEFSQDLFPIITTTTVGDGTSPANKFAGPNNTNKAVSSFTLSTNSGTDTVTGMIITGTNTANVAASGVKIYRDNGTTANEWDASDTLVGTASFSGNTATFTGLNIAVSTTSTQYIITYDITASPTNGQTLTGVVTSVTCTNTVTNNDSTDATITIDAAAPTTTDNQTSSNWQATEKTVTLTPNDGTGSGVTAATGIYGCFGTGCSPALLGGNTMTTNCGAGNECTYDVRYYSVDNVGNTESTKTSAYQARIDRKTPTDGTLTATAGNGQVSLIWSGFSDSGSGLNTTDTYKLVFLTTGFPNANCTNGTDLTAVTTQTSYTHTGRTNGITYYYRICAYDEFNNISAGATASATPSPLALSYSSEPGYDDGKDPDTGNATTSFTFKVVYTNGDNRAPSSGYPKIYIGDNDGYASYTMSLDTTAAASLRDGSYTNGEQYVYSSIEFGAAEDIRFYFEAADGVNPTVTLPSGAPTSYSTGPSVYLMYAQNMAGVPKCLGTGCTAGDSYSSVLGDDSGLNWCMTYSSIGLYSGTYVDCTYSDMYTGKGYWIWASHSYWELDEPPGVGNVATASFEIGLQVGWNIISNPYNKRIPLQAASGPRCTIVRNGVESTDYNAAVTSGWIYSTIYEYEGSTNGYVGKVYNGTPPAVLEPWIGYWIYVPDTTFTTMRLKVYQ